MSKWTEPDPTPLKLKPNELRLAGPIQHDSIVDGDGLRAMIFTQGCRRKCPGCHNPESWDESAGMVVTLDEIKDELRKFRGQKGITFSGGEPMLQAKQLKNLAAWARRELDWDVWCFTGFTYEKLKELGGDKWDLVKNLDVLIDGPFILSQRDLSLKFRGSKNQRLIRLKDGKIETIL